MEDLTRYLGFIKGYEAASAKISAWSLSILGGSILVIIQGEYRPTCLILRLFYILFVVGWVFIGISLYHGKLLSQHAMTGDLHSKNSEALVEIMRRCNSYYRHQLDWFYACLCPFGIWLLLYISYWIFLA